MERALGHGASEYTQLRRWVVSSKERFDQALLELCVVHAPPEFTFRAAEMRQDADLLVEVDAPIGRVRVTRPGRLALAVGISAARELCPVALDREAELAIRLGGRLHRPEDIRDLGAVRRAQHQR